MQENADQEKSEHEHFLRSARSFPISVLFFGVLFSVGDFFRGLFSWVSFFRGVFFTAAKLCVTWKRFPL